MPRHAELFAATRLAGNHAGMYGAVDLASNDINGLLARALPDVTKCDASYRVMAGLVPAIHVFGCHDDQN